MLNAGTENGGLRRDETLDAVGAATLMLEGRVSVYRTTARNVSANAENRIHSDVVAAQFGFEGALVPGAAVFGHMTHPLVDTLGPDRLSGWQVSVRFVKPAYDGDSLVVSHRVEGDTRTVQCRARDILLAELHTRPLAPDAKPTVDLGIACVVDGEVAAEIEHTSIFCIASAPRPVASAPPVAHPRNA